MFNINNIKNKNMKNIFYLFKEEYDRMVWKYFQISKKANRKAK